MKLKTLRTDGRTEKVYDGEIAGHHQLYPDGAKRVIIVYFLFPKTIGGERKRGLQIVEQEASINTSTATEVGVRYNRWADRQFISPQSLEFKLETN